MIRLVHGIAQNSRPLTSAEDFIVQFAGIRRRHDQKNAGQIGREKAPLLPYDSARPGSFADARRCLRSDYTNLRAAAYEAAHLGLGNIPSSNHEAWPFRELQEYGK